MINICGIELYRLELERMFENGYKYIIRYRDIIELRFSHCIKDNFYGRVIKKLDKPYTKKGRYVEAKARDVNYALGYELLIED